MTVGLLEAITSAIGDELTLLAGYRSTRLTDTFLGEQQVDYGTLTASSADAGITITLSAGTFDGVSAGDRFRLLDGFYRGVSATIDIVGGPTSITLDGAGIGVNFTNQSWEVVQDPETTMDVETTLDWDSSGEVICNGSRYTYTSKTLTTLDGIQHIARNRSWGRIQTVAGSLLVDGETVTIGDGYGHTYTFEFDDNGSFTVGNIRVAFTSTDTAEDIRDAFKTAFENTDLTINIYAKETNQLELQHWEDGTRGNVTITETVANTGFLVLGMRDGTLVVDGAEQDHAVLAEVVDFTRTYSSKDIYRRAFLVEYAAGRDLSQVGRNIGVDRHPTMSDDDEFREVVKVVAYGMRATMRIFEQVLTAVLGTSGWEIFEDSTANWTIDPVDGVAMFPYNGSNNRCTLYLRREDTEEEFVGKTFVDGLERRPITSGVTLTLGQTPDKLVGLWLAKDSLRERLIVTGDKATGSSGGTVITAIAGAFPAGRVQIGDVFVIQDGILKGKQGTIASTPSTSQITIGAVEGSPHYEIGQNFEITSWRIYRPYSNFRRYKPTGEQYVEYEGGSPRQIWDYVATGGAAEASTVTVRNFAPSLGGRFTEIDTLPGETFVYRCYTRIQPDSVASFELVARARNSPSLSSTAGLQWYFEIRDGARRLAVGLIATATPGENRIGFIDTSTGSFIWSPSYTTDNDTDFHVFRILKNGQGTVTFEVDGAVVETAAYTSFDTTTDYELRFGCADSSYTLVEFDIKQANWSSDLERDFNNTRVTTGSLTGGGSRDLVDSGAGGWFVAGDVGRFVRIYDFTALNAGNGNALGDWEIESYTDADTVTLIGPTKPGASFVGSAFPRRIVVRGAPDAFVYPNHLGHKIRILSGPNAGDYTISTFLNPVTLTDGTADFVNSVDALQYVASASDILYTFATNVIEVSIDLPDPADDTVVEWCILPVFPADAGPFPYDIVDTSTVVGTGVTLRQTLPIATVGTFVPLLEAHYTTVTSAQTHTEDEANADSGGVYDIYPFYIYDQWGYLRFLLEDLSAAGVTVDFDSLSRDDAGLHIIE